MNKASMNGGGSGCIEVDGPQGVELRPIDHVRVDTRDRARQVVPQLRAGEEVFHTLDGRCAVVQTGYGFQP